MAASAPAAVKVVDTLTSQEAEIWRALQSIRIRQDPRFHTAKLLDILESPTERSLVVTERWDKKWRQNCCTPGQLNQAVEIIFELATQMLEFLCLLHENNICHCDIHLSNIIRDSTTPKNQYRFALIDFGESRIFHRAKPHWITGRRAAYKPPEMSRDVPYDPYKLDVYQLGRMLQSQFILLDYEDRELSTWIGRVLNDNPAGRPSIADAFQEFQSIRPSPSTRSTNTIAK